MVFVLLLTDSVSVLQIVGTCLMVFSEYAAVKETSFLTSGIVRLSSFMTWLINTF